MRCDQYIGLPPSAKKWINENCKVKTIKTVTTTTFSDGRVETKEYTRSEPEMASYKKFSGMFGDEYALHEYETVTGLKVREFMQNDEWSSGPVFHFGLEDEHGNPMFLWQRCEKCFEFHDGEHDAELCSAGVHHGD